MSSAPPIFAGMPSPGVLTDSAVFRLQNISFFLLGLLVCTAVVWGLWRLLRRDFPKLPPMSIPAALAAVVLWGLVFIIVLTMISGARELMTPGAWSKVGATYRLTEEEVPASDLAQRQYRKQHLERLRAVLWKFAATHEGRYPSVAEAETISEESWEVPEAGGMRYRYVEGLTAIGSRRVLVIEPELDPGTRLVLWTDGDVASLRSDEIAALLMKEGQP